MSAPPEGPVTRNEELVLAALRRSGSPQTAYQLLDTLRGEGLKAPPQVYRALRSLSLRHLVHRLDSLNAFVACAHHHAHDDRALVFMICNGCNRVDEVADERLDGLIRSVAEESRFEVGDAATEVRGTCVACRTAEQVKTDLGASTTG